MKATRILGLITLAASLGLAACGGGGAANTALPTVAPTSSVDAYTGPAPATADVQAFEINLWNNIRGQNRCGQCHNATTPAQMPNFARSDNVNLAYAQANTVVNLAQPSTSIMVVKVSGGHNCWLADPSACGQILTTWISNWANATGASSATTVSLTAPPVQSVGQSLSFSSAAVAATDYQNDDLYVDEPILLEVPFFARESGHAAIAVLRGSEHHDRLSGRDTEDRFHRLRAAELARPSRRPAASTRASTSAWRSTSTIAGAPARSMRRRCWRRSRRSHWMRRRPTWIPAWW